MDRSKSELIGLVLGLILAVMSVEIAGFGAALSVPAGVLKALTDSSDLLALIVVDFFTIAVPFALAYILLAIIGKYVLKTVNANFYLLLIAPLALLQLYFFVQTPLQFHFIVPALVRLVLLAICCYVLICSNKPQSTERSGK